MDELPEEKPEKIGDKAKPPFVVWPDIDDKTLVIVCVTILGIFSLYMLGPDKAIPIISNIVTGLFGVAVGRQLGK